MKKLSIVLFALILLNAKLYSQSEEKVVLKINPLSAFVSTGSVFLEMKLDNTKSFQMGVAYTGLGLGDLSYSGIILTPEMRFYTKQRALSGLYLAPYFRFQRFEITDEGTTPNNELTLTTIGGGLMFGRQWVYSSGFVFDMFAGPSYNDGDVKYKSGSQTSDDFAYGLKGFGVRIGIAIGFGF